jgi:hypothetical protein
VLELTHVGDRGEELLHDRGVGEVLRIADARSGELGLDEGVGVGERGAQRLLDDDRGAGLDRVERMPRMALRRAAHDDDVGSRREVFVAAGDGAHAAGHLLRLLTVA